MMDIKKKSVMARSQKTGKIYEFEIFELDVQKDFKCHDNIYLLLHWDDTRYYSFISYKIEVFTNVAEWPDRHLLENGDIKSYKHQGFTHLEILSNTENNTHENYFDLTNGKLAIIPSRV